MAEQDFTTTPIIIRQAGPQDLPFMWDMLYEAAAASPAIRAMGKEAALALPPVRRYLEGWGARGDAGVVAVDRHGNRLGAAWYRLFPQEMPGYGFVSADVPELSIGVVAEARGRGVGGALLEALKELARNQGFKALSLSVDRLNPAVRLYRRHGFTDAGVSLPQDSSVTMVVILNAGYRPPEKIKKPTGKQDSNGTG
jgi:ribosomal protein S18 acetylase RimI-like enzyme